MTDVPGWKSHMNQMKWSGYGMEISRKVRKKTNQINLEDSWYYRINTRKGGR